MSIQLNSIWQHCMGWDFSIFEMHGSNLSSTSIPKTSATLDFVIGQKWCYRYGMLWLVHIHLHTKFCEDISNSGRVTVIFSFSEWRSAAILDFVTGQKWHNSTLRTVHVYHHAKFGDNISTGGWVIVFWEKNSKFWRPPFRICIWQFWTTHEVYLRTWSSTENLVLIKLLFKISWF